MTNIRRVAVFSSGGDSPGMNAAIRAVVRTALYHDLHVFGIERGYEGMIDGRIKRIERFDVANIIHRGGTILRTARSKRFMTKEGRKAAYEVLRANSIDACIAIGGNGTYTGAKVFMEEFDFPIIGVPGTIDNDIAGTDFTIGFDTAINTAIESVDKIRDTADSHNRLFFIEVMGRHSGYIGLHSGLGSGASCIFVPETAVKIDKLVEEIKLAQHRKKMFHLVVVAEGNQNGNATEIAMKVKEIMPDLDSKVTIIGHLQRGGSPTCADRVLASQLGYGAVKGLLEGRSGCAVGVMSNEIVFTPFERAIVDLKPLPQELLNMARILSM